MRTEEKKRIDEQLVSNTSEDCDTRHYSIWMDRFSFIACLTKWGNENRKLSGEELFGALLAWNLTHVKEEAIQLTNIQLKKDFQNER